MRRPRYNIRRGYDHLNHYHRDDVGMWCRRNTWAVGSAPKTYVATCFWCISWIHYSVR